MKPYLGMGGRETSEILAVPGQHVYSESYSK
jgi:hypothetical protein